MLRNAAGFTLGDIRLTNRVKQGRFTMVHMT